MKNVNLRKMTAFAAALALAAQSGMTVLNAEEAESETAAQTVTEGSDTVTAEVPADDENQSETENRSIKENPIVKCIYNTYFLFNLLFYFLF